LKFYRGRVGPLNNAGFHSGYDYGLDHALEVIGEDVGYLVKLFQGP
jgi:hypothetical protein